MPPIPSSWASGSGGCDAGRRDGAPSPQMRETPSGCPKQRVLNGGWKIYEDKIGGGIQIVLALVVDDPDVLRSGGALIRQDFVNPARRQQIRIIATNTNRKSSFRAWCSSHRPQSRNRLILIFLWPMPWASNQWTSARRTVPSKRRTVATPLSFRQRPLPYRLRRRGKIRILVPIAIGSTSVISPTISKSIRPHWLELGVVPAARLGCQRSLPHAYHTPSSMASLRGV